MPTYQRGYESSGATAHRDEAQLLLLRKRTLELAIGEANEIIFVLFRPICSRNLTANSLLLNDFFSTSKSVSVWRF